VSYMEGFFLTDGVRGIPQTKGKVGSRVLVRGLKGGKDRLVVPKTPSRRTGAEWYWREIGGRVAAKKRSARSGKKVEKEVGQKTSEKGDGQDVGCRLNRGLRALCNSMSGLKNKKKSEGKKKRSLASTGAHG